MKHVPVLDGAAIGASLLCLIHCIGFPILFALLPAAASIGVPGGEWLHVALLLTAVPMSGLALVFGYRGHGERMPLVLGVAGIAALAAGVLLHAAPPWEPVLTVCGSILLAAAHVGNWRRRWGPAPR